MRYVGTFFLWALVVAACSSGSSGFEGTPSADASPPVDGNVGPGSVMLTAGSVSGMTVVGTEAVGYLRTTTNTAMSSTSAGVSVASTTGTCSLLQTHYHLGTMPYVPDAASLFIQIDAQGTSIAPGTYAITMPIGEPAPGAPNVGAGYFALDPNCNATARILATQGTITLTLVTEHTIAGSFDLTAFSPTSNDRATGTFTAPVCPFDVAGTGVDGGFSLDAGDGGSNCPP